MCSPSPKGGIGQRVQERGLNLRHGKDFFVPTRSVRQPLFETSDLRHIHHLDSRLLHCRTPEKWFGGEFLVKWFGFRPSRDNPLKPSWIHLTSGVAPANQTKERAKTKSSWISPIFVNSGVFFLRKTSTIQIELLFRNAPVKSSWTDLSLVWFAGVTPDNI